MHGQWLEICTSIANTTVK